MLKPTSRAAAATIAWKALAKNLWTRSIDIILRTPPPTHISIYIIKRGIMRYRYTHRLAAHIIYKYIIIIIAWARVARTDRSDRVFCTKNSSQLWRITRCNYPVLFHFIFFPRSRTDRQTDTHTHTLINKLPIVCTTVYM